MSLPEPVGKVVETDGIQTVHLFGIRMDVGEYLYRATDTQGVPKGYVRAADSLTARDVYFTLNRIIQDLLPKDPLSQNSRVSDELRRLRERLSGAPEWTLAVEPQNVNTPSREPGSNTGHGHVWARPDGVKARCGGPGMCQQCSLDSARWGTSSVAPS